MRITGGQARGIPLKTGKLTGVRPATDRSRESLFSSLGGQLENSLRVLDLFAGVGSYGLEALSRGAGSCCFVEKDPKTLAVLKENCRAVCKSAGRDSSVAAIRRGDAFQFQSPNPVDLVFMDPPYELTRQRILDLMTLAEACLLPEGTWILEAPADLEIPQGPFVLVGRLGKKSGRDEPALYRFTLNPPPAG
jgi:16S rRNA (guanine966-N2)-methyltransferase